MRLREIRYRSIGEDTIYRALLDEREHDTRLYQRRWRDESGGAIIFSYLDLALPPDWAVFEVVLTIFLGRDVVRVWAERIGFS